MRASGGLERRAQPWPCHGAVDVGAAWLGRSLLRVVEARTVTFSFTRTRGSRGGTLVDPAELAVHQPDSAMLTAVAGAGIGSVTVRTVFSRDARTTRSPGPCVRVVRAHAVDAHAGTAARWCRRVPSRWYPPRTACRFFELTPHGSATGVSGRSGDSSWIAPRAARRGSARKSAAPSNTARPDSNTIASKRSGDERLRARATLRMSCARSRTSVAMDGPDPAAVVVGDAAAPDLERIDLRADRCCARPPASRARTRDRRSPRPSPARGRGRPSARR